MRSIWGLRNHFVRCSYGGIWVVDRHHLLLSSSSFSLAFGDGDDVLAVISQTKPRRLNISRKCFPCACAPNLETRTSKLRWVASVCMTWMWPLFRKLQCPLQLWQDLDSSSRSLAFGDGDDGVLSVISQNSTPEVACNGKILSLRHHMAQIERHRASKP